MLKFKYLLFSILGTLLMLLVLMVLAEFLLRGYYAITAPESHNGFRINAHKAYGFLGDPASEGRHKTREFNVPMKVNEQGFRDSINPNRDTALIALLGDSYSWGTGVEEKERFGNLIARGTGVPVANYGLPGTGTVNQLATYQDFIANSSAKVVLLQFFPNDVENNSWIIPSLKARGGITKENLEAELDARKAEGLGWLHGGSSANPLVRLVWNSALKRFLLGFYHTVLSAGSVPSEVVHEGETYMMDRSHLDGMSNWSAALKVESALHDEAWQLTALALRLLQAETQANGQKLYIVYLPYQEQVNGGHWPTRQEAFDLEIPLELVDFDLPRKKLEHFAEILELPFIDTTPQLVATARQGRKADMFYPLDGHLTVSGNAIVSQAVINALNNE